MINYGSAPAKDEIEVTLFGPGYGEAIAVHLGEDAWLLVDSCIDPSSNEPASKTYLEHIGVECSQVHAIVASHWHDDHVRGISDLASSFTDANFIHSSTFNNKEARSFLSAYSGTSSLGLSKGTEELFLAIKSSQQSYPAHHKSIVMDAVLNGRKVMVTALSPLPASFSQSMAHFAQYIPGNDQAINHAPELNENFESIALHLDMGDDAILLGADLMNHKSKGWSAIVKDQWSGSRQPSSLFKVPHHGSKTGDCSEIWRGLLKSNPMACLTPFTKGRHHLPTNDDKKRIKSKTSGAYISSGASRKPDMDSRQLKRLGDICKNLALVETGFGAVRLRKKFQEKSWRVELFGAAQKL